MTENLLLIHATHDPRTGKKRIGVQESSLKSRGLWLNGRKSVRHESLNGSTELVLPGMMVVGGDRGLPNDLEDKPQERCRLYRGQTVSLRFTSGRIVHTIAVAGTTEEALALLARIKSQRVQ